jgi:hypothetical protein
MSLGMRSDLDCALLTPVMLLFPLTIFNTRSSGSSVQIIFCNTFLVLCNKNCHASCVYINTFVVLPFINFLQLLFQRLVILMFIPEN